MSSQFGKWLALVGLSTGFSVGTVLGAVIPDATGEEFSNNPHLDIHSVEVTNDASDITFKINLVGDPIATNWGKYMIGIDSIVGGASSGNGWGRPINMSSGMDYWIGSWADFGTGQEVYHFGGANWVRDRTTYDGDTRLPLPVVTSDSVALTVPLSLLGLGDGQEIRFDVYSSGGGGGDSANDASSNPTQSISNWPGPYDSGDVVSVYSVVVPEPGSMALIGIAAAGLLGGRRNRVRS